MNCPYIQDELLLNVGSEVLPDNLQAHLDACSDCRAFWTELCSATRTVGSDEDFFLDQSTIETQVANVDRRIDELELGKVTDVRSAWRSFVPAAAAVVLLVGLSSAVYMMGWFGSGPVLTDRPVEDTLMAQAPNVMDIIDENDIDYILYEFAADRNASTSELLMEDLTEEELEYLENNFDVGELL